MSISSLLRRCGAPSARGALLLAATLGFSAASGCDGRTISAPGGEASASEAGEAGTYVTPAAGRAGSGGSSGGGNSSSGSGGAGASQGPGGATSGGSPSGTGGSAGKAGASAAGSGGKATTGGSGGKGGNGNGGTLGGSEPVGSSGYGDGGYPPGYMCQDGVCGIQCEQHGVIGLPGSTFWDACNECQCGLDGVATCEKKNCDLDCEYLGNEYQGAYGEAQYCLTGDTPDPCDRSQLNRLDCTCMTAVSGVEEFKVLTAQWAKKWADAGCQKAPGVVCPPCPPVGEGVCDRQQGICVYQ